MWFWLSMIALLMWSGSDLFSKIGSHPNDRYSHWKIVISVGLIMGAHALCKIFIDKTPISWEIIVTYLPASALYIASMLLGYVGLRHIELSVSSPICNSSGAVAAVLTFLFLGQRLKAMQTFAVALTCVGIIALGFVEYFEDDEARMRRQEKTNIRYHRSFLALLLPVLYCVLDALGTFADAAILETLDEDSANVAYELTFLCMGILSFFYVVVLRREKFSIPREAPKLIAGIFETAGQLAYVYALSANAVAAEPIISAYCAVSVLWGRLFLKEKLSWKHYAAIGVAIAGIVFMGILEGLDCA